MAVKINILTDYNSAGSNKAIRELGKLEKAAVTAGDVGAAKMFALSSKLTGISVAAATAGASLTRNLTVPLALVGAASANAAIQFETAFTGVEKTVDGTAEQMAALEQGIRDMAQEIPASTTEISAVAEAAGQLGIQTDNVLDFTEVMINLGNATNLSADEAATALAQLANIVQMPQDKFDELGSTIVALGNNMATTEADIVSMGQRIAAAGDQVGMSEDQIMALAATLSSVGIEAEAGGSAISKTLIGIESAVQSGGKELETWAETAGMSAEEFTAAWESDPAAALNSVVTGLGDMESQGSSTLQQLEKLGITEVRQRDALLRMAGAGEAYTDALALANDAWADNNALATEAEKRYATNASQLEILKNKVTDAGISLGEGMLPALNDAIDAAGPMIEWVGDLAKSFSELDEQQQKQIVQWVGIAAAAGPALSIVSKGLQPVIALSKGVGALKLALGDGAAAAPKWAQAIAGASGKASEAVKGLNTQMTASKVATAGLAAAVVLLGYKLSEVGGDAMAAKAGLGDLEGAAQTALDTSADLGDRAKAMLFALNPAGAVEALTTVYEDFSAGLKGNAESLDGVASAAYDVGARFAENRTSAEQLAIVTSDVAFATDGATFTVVNYRLALEDLTAAQEDSSDAALGLEGAQLRVESAEARMTETLAQFPAESLEAREAVHTYNVALDALESAEAEAAASAAEVNAKVAEFPEPSSSKLADWLAYYQAIGNKANYAATKALLANQNVNAMGYAKSSTGGYNIPLHGTGTYATSPHLAIVGDEPEVIIPLGDQSAAAKYLPILFDSLDMSGGSQYPATSGYGSSRSISIAPGAISVQVVLQSGSQAEAVAAADTISDRLLSRLAMGV